MLIPSLKPLVNRQSLVPWGGLLLAVAMVISHGVMTAQEGPVGPPPGGGFAPRGGPGGMAQQELKLVKKHDLDGDGRLNLLERKAAREQLAKDRTEGRGPRGFGGRRPRPGGVGGAGDVAPKPGVKVPMTSVKPAGDAPLYAAKTLRTFFLEFESPDWEKELSDFNNTDVEVPATLTVDGKAYKNVGVHFRGMSSFGMVGEGQKRSFNLSMDFVEKEQNLMGYRTLNLLNSHEDPSFLRAPLFYEICRDYVPAPKANFVRVVINGENWGIYCNAQQFNKEFLKESFGTTQGTRWKAQGSPNGRASFSYLGDDVEAYKRVYTIKSKDNPKAWADLVQLCKVLHQTPVESLPAAIQPLLDVDGALKFLALDNALINNDGYWIRTSDFNLYQDANGIFHLIPHDANETFNRPGGPRFGGGGRRGMRPPNTDGPGGPDGLGGPGGPGGPAIRGVELDPLVAAQDANKPLISKLLAVPDFRAKYLRYVGDIAERWLNWERLGPIAFGYHRLISEDVAADTRKLDSTEAFQKNLTETISSTGGGPFGGKGHIGLKEFADQRRAYLKSYVDKSSTGK